MGAGIDVNRLNPASWLTRTYCPGDVAHAQATVLLVIELIVLFGELMLDHWDVSTMTCHGEC